jgi:hypothetical protein
MATEKKGMFPFVVMRPLLAASLQPWLAGSISEVMGEGPTHKAPLKQELAIS